MSLDKFNLSNPIKVTILSTIDSNSSPELIGNKDLYKSCANNKEFLILDPISPTGSANCISPLSNFVISPAIFSRPEKFDEY